MGKYEVTEVCPHCEREITLNWDVEADGYQIFCPECGKAVMLCSMCDRSPCDWSEKGCKHSKDNYETINNYGWIPVEERMPENEDYVFMSIAGWPITMIGRYKIDAEGGAFYIGDEDNSCVSQNLFVIAWRPLPEPYQPEQEAAQRPEWKDRMLHTFLGRAS